MGFPIRKSTDQRVFAPPRSLSQRITSFIACACQGIHQLPLRHLIVLIANAHPKIALQTVLAQKDQLLEIGPGARLGKPIICGRLSVSPRQTRAFDARSAERSKPIGDRTQAKESEQIFSLRCQTEQAVDQGPLQNHLRMTFILSTPGMVEPDGIEPTTSCLQSRRSPS